MNRKVKLWLNVIALLCLVAFIVIVRHGIQAAKAAEAAQLPPEGWRWAGPAWYAHYCPVCNWEELPRYFSDEAEFMKVVDENWRFASSKGQDDPPGIEFPQPAVHTHSPQLKHHQGGGTR